MASCAAPGIARSADNRPFFHCLPRTHTERIHMGILGCVTVNLNHNIIPVVAVICRRCHRTVMRRIYGRACGYCYIHTPVKFLVPCDRVFPVSVIARHIIIPVKVKRRSELLKQTVCFPVHGKNLRLFGIHFPGNKVL